MQTIPGGVTAPIGFAAAGVFCGIKKRGKDLALIVSNRPAAVAGTLTVNRMRAPCVEWAQKILRKGRVRAIVANSGNANCCTGRRGVRDNRAMAEETAKLMGIPATEVLVASTGVIGQPLPMEQVRNGIRSARAQLKRTGSHSAAEAILTTDLRPKEFAVCWKTAGRVVTVGGIAKGSGMIAPHMATMLAFLTTDLTVEPALLREALKQAVPHTFNAITVDGEMSTNDMVLLMANGGAGLPPLKKNSPVYRDFLRVVREICETLAKEIVRDGEGVTRLFTVKVTGAASSTEAMRAARQIANSLLVKTMVAGRDPNWGRVAAAAGACGIPFKPERLMIRLGLLTVFKGGEPASVSRAAMLEQVDQPEIVMGVDLGRGKAEAKILSGDLTEEYVKINAKYTS
ncbi:MAG: bifunctional glutamate N-acetyltransferase/amino-acid acetyltransferase ArgJ [Candidatus Omnitrophota bacterium]|nr:bifunctional glutamate N-acetyltransferase/amino-acid acetyltransferase ArgJ [Candidatus Omnitrophota bacterium]